MLLPGILFSTICALSLAQPEDLEDVATTGALNLALEHSLDGGATFSPRGSISVETSRSGSVALSSDDQREVDAGTVARLGELCTSGGLYLLKVRAQRQGGGEPVTHRTVADPCMLVQNRLSDVIVLHVDWKLQMVGVSVVAPKRGDAARAKRSSAVPAAAASAPTRFSSTVTMQAMEVGPTPDTAAFIQKMEQEKLQKQRGETKDNRSFFAKYWMYIIPVVLFLAMSSGNPDGGGGR